MNKVEDDESQVFTALQKEYVSGDQRGGTRYQSEQKQCCKERKIIVIRLAKWNGVRCVIDNLVSQRPSSDNSPGIDEASSDSRIGANNVSATTSHQNASAWLSCPYFFLFFCCVGEVIQP